MAKPLDDLTERYAAYAGAFEVAIIEDDWTRVESFFTRDVVIRFHTPPFVGTCRGLDEVADYFRSELDNFDRRFDERIVEPPVDVSQRGTTVTAHWRAMFRREGAPDLHLHGVEVARFRSQHIYRLDGRFDEGVGAEATRWLEAHGDKLRPRLGDIMAALIAGGRGE